MTADRVGFRAQLVEAERLREEIGRIPVPLGYCTEQHNVRALGAHCPFSHQCLGCEHFRTDPSHLPDLYAYLERLLRDPRAAPCRSAAASGVGAGESDPRRRGDPHRPHPDPRRRGSARRARRPASEPSCSSCSACCARPARGWTARSRSSRSPRPATPSRRSSRRRSRRCPQSAAADERRGVSDRAAAMIDAKQRDQRRRSTTASRAVIAQIRDQGREETSRRR